MATTPNYDINYDDERFGKVESDKSQALTELEQTYGGMIDNVDSFYKGLNENLEQQKEIQTKVQNDNTDFAIEQIEQQKDQANKDYKKEQSGAYVDWQKQSNQYGAEAEKMASAGLARTGYSESSQVSMYNTYQNRLATARESYNKAVLNYDNAIKDARLQNNAALAEIALSTMQQQLELSLQGFQYKNQLILEQANKKTELDNIYYNRYQDVLQQINTENAMAEQIRQYNETQKFQADQAALDRNFQAQQAEINRQFEKEMLTAKTEKEKELLKIQQQNDLAKLKKQQEYELAQLKASQTTITKSNTSSGTKSNALLNSLAGALAGTDTSTKSSDFIGPTQAPTKSSTKSTSAKMYQFTSGNSVGGLRSGAKRFVDTIKLKAMTEPELRQCILDYAEDYDLEVNDIKAMYKYFGLDSSWVNAYKNKGLFGFGKGIEKK